MLEQLKDLEPALEREFRKAVGVGELTVFRANLSSRTGWVLTTKKVYLLEKKWWKVKCILIALTDLESVTMMGRDKIQLQSKRDVTYSLKVDGEHFPEALKAVNRILELLNKI